MLIKQLATRTGLTTHTIRFYEKCGFIKGTRPPANHTNNYLIYSDDTVDRLLLIKEAKSVGFSLAEIQQLLDAWFSNTLTIAEKVAVLDQKSDAIHAKIIELQEMQKLIEQYKADVINNAC